MPIYYHGTNAVNLPSILTRGLVPGASPGADAVVRRIKPHAFMNYSREAPDRAHSVFLTKEPATAKFFASLSRHPAVVTVDLPETEAMRLVKDEATQGPDAWRYVGTVNPAWIKDVRPVHSGAADIGLKFEKL